MGKTLTGMRADLRTDLKDSGTLWTNAELDRSVERAVADLSRFLPLEKNYEITTDFEVTNESWTSPAAAVPGKIVAAKDISVVTDGDICALAAVTLDKPRPVAILITDANASITSFTIIVKGTDRDDNYIEESFYFSGGLSQTSKKYFYTITEVELDQMTGEGVADVLNVGTASHVGVWVQLANKPITPGSDENVDDGTTGYTLDKDYEMDYANGRIRLKAGGGMVAATAYYIDYDKSKIEIDLTPIKHELIRVDRLIYPTSDIPQTFIGVDVWGDILTLQGGVAESQERMAEAKHAVIRYCAKHTPPSVAASGSYPDFLDNTIILAASAYALFIKALEFEHQANTDMAAFETAIGNIAAIHILADAALDKVITYLETNVNENTKFWLTKITTDIASLRTAIGIALDAANAYLDEVDTTDLVGAEGVQTTINTYLTGITEPSVKKYLETGDDKINIINIGEGVPGLYRDYASVTFNAIIGAYLRQRADFLAEATARTNAALGYVQEAGQRLSNLRSYMEQARAWDAVADTFITEATGRLGEMDRYLTESTQYQSAANIDLVIATRFREEAIERRNEAWSIWRDPKMYIGDFALTPTRMPGYYGVVAPSTKRL